MCEPELEEYVANGSAVDDSNACPLRYSLDRFDEKITQKILSFLRFSDCVRFESVSKLWQSFVYSKRTELYLESHEEDDHYSSLNGLLRALTVTDYTTGEASGMGYKCIHKRHLRSILTKCQTIEEIYFSCYCDEEVMQIIAEFCPQLKSLKMDIMGINEKCLLEFGHKMGHQLEVVEFYNSEFGLNYVKKFFQFCPDVKKLYIQDTIALINDNESFLPNIQVLYNFQLTANTLYISQILATKYSHVLKELSLYLHELNASHTKTLITNISRIESLEELNLVIVLNETNEGDDNINDQIICLATGCSKLKTFDLEIRCNGLDVSRLLASFESFQSLVKLDVCLDKCEQQIDGSVECLKNCPNLKSLTIDIPSIGESFVRQIDTVLPNLEELDFDCETEITDDMIYILSKLKKLNELQFSRRQHFHKDITDDSIRQLIHSCRRLRRISFSSRPNITNKTIDSLISYALMNEKKKFEFFCGSAHGVNDDQFQHINRDDYIHSIPYNLTIWGGFW